MEKQKPKTKEEARQYAIDWQNWQSEQSLSGEEMMIWQQEFRLIGAKFDLLKEFYENGIV